MDVLNLDETIEKINKQTLPQARAQADEIIDRLSTVITGEHTALVRDLSQTISGLLGGVQAIVDSLPKRAEEIIGAPSVAALADEYEIVISFRRKSS